MRLRRWEAWIVGVDRGVPYEECRGRYFTRAGAAMVVHRYLFVAGHSVNDLARMSGWDVEMRGDVRRVLS